VYLVLFQFGKVIQILHNISLHNTSGYEIKTLGGFNDRDIAGMPGVKSIHARGAALDINPETNPMGSTLVTDLPRNIASIASQFGLGWGGNWTNKKDAMHFSAAESEGGSLLKAKYGGIFSGPESGYPVLLHGRERVEPLGKPGDLNQVTKTELPRGNDMQLQNNFDKFFAMQSEFLSVLSNKLDNLDYRLAKSNDIQENILTYSST
jgi:hypothetical protein